MAGAEPFDMNFEGLKRFAVCFILLGVWSVLGTRANPKIQMSTQPSWLRSIQQQPQEVDLEDINSGYYYELLDKQVHLGTQEQFFKEVRVLIDEQGAESAGNISISFDPSYQQLIIHDLHVTRDGQTLDRRKIGDFKVVASETDLSRFLYNGTYMAYHILDDLRKGDKITLSYTLKGFNPVFKNKFADSYYFEGYEPAGLKHLHYFVPKGRDLRIKSHNQLSFMNESPQPDGKSYYLELTGTSKGEFYPYTPGWYTELKWLEASEFLSWSEVGEWASQVNPVLPLKAGSALKSYAEELWEQCQGDHYAYLKLVADFVQNEVRYMGVMIGEHSHRANQPEKIFMQRYGDCKDKSVLMVSMLQDQGIDASLVLVNSMQDQGMDKQLPSPFAFDHMVVSVSINGRQQMIDPTISNQGGPIRERYFPAYGHCLDLATANELRNLSHDPNGRIHIRETYQLQKGGSATLLVESVYTGAHADQIRQYFKSTAKNLIQKQYLEFYQKLHVNLSLKKPLEFSEKLESNTFTVREEYDIDKIYNNEAGTDAKYIAFFSHHLHEYLPDIHSKRPAPVALTFPLNLEHDIFVINDGGKPVNIDNASLHYQRGSYNFSKVVSSSSDTLKIQHFLSFHRSYIPIEDVESYVEEFHDRNKTLYYAAYVDPAEGAILQDQSANGISTINWFMVLFVLLLIAGVVFFWRSYVPSKPTGLIPVAEVYRPYHQLGGFVILLGLTMFIRLGLFIWELGQSDYFLMSLWNTYQWLDGVSEITWKVLILADVVQIVFNLSGVFLSLYLFFDKRDIFPQTYFVYLLVSSLLLILIRMVSVGYLGEATGVSIELKEFVQTVFFAAVWLSYIYYSKRVKGTFIRPYIAFDKEISTRSVKYEKTEDI